MDVPASFARALASLTVAELLQAFHETALRRDTEFEVPVRNRLMDKLAAINAELKQRQPDARPLVARFLEDPSESVRLNAAARLMPIDPQRAVPVLERLKDADRPDVAMTAGVILDLWRKGELTIDSDPVPPPEY